MPRKRITQSAAEKVAILRRHLLEKVPVLSLCEEHGLHPNTFYLWQKQLFENGNAAFETKRPSMGVGEQRRIADLEAKLARKNEMLVELLDDYVRLKTGTSGAHQSDKPM